MSLMGFIARSRTKLAVVLEGGIDTQDEDVQRGGNGRNFYSAFSWSFICIVND